MIISRTPLRISFFGGGTDYPAWYRAHSGATLATTINRYNYLICRHLPPFFDYKYRIRYRLIEETRTIAEIKHPSVRECLNFFSITDGVEIQHNSDLPAMSGLGSSSSFTVGLVHALAALKGQMVTKRQLALSAIDIEQNLIRENVGSQDQTAAAFGGFNLIRFGGPQEISVTPVTISRGKLQQIQNHCMLFFTGLTRIASDIAAEQIRMTREKEAELTAMLALVDEAYAVLNRPGDECDDFGRLMNEGWKLKKSMTHLVSNDRIDEIYNIAIKAGALGGKLLGAGGGGFMLFYVKPEQHHQVREKLKPLLYVPVSFENLGSQIIYYAPFTE